MFCSWGNRETLIRAASLSTQEVCFNHPLINEAILIVERVSLMSLIHRNIVVCEHWRWQKLITLFVKETMHVIYVSPK